MQKALMTAQEYADNTTLLKTLFVDLDITDLSPDTINAKICEVQNNFNKVGRLAIDSINNLHLARTMVDANKLNKELMHSSSMLATAVSSLKSSCPPAQPGTCARPAKTNCWLKHITSPLCSCTETWTSPWTYCARRSSCSRACCTSTLPAIDKWRTK